MGRDLEKKKINDTRRIDPGHLVSPRTRKNLEIFILCKFIVQFFIYQLLIIFTMLRQELTYYDNEWNES